MLTTSKIKPLEKIQDTNSKAEVLRLKESKFKEAYKQIDTRFQRIQTRRATQGLKLFEINKETFLKRSVFCAINLCLYDNNQGNLPSVAQMHAMIDSFIDRGHDYGIFLYPDDNEGENPEAYQPRLDEWYKNYKEIVDKVPKNKIFHRKMYRDKDKWNAVEKEYSDYLDKKYSEKDIDKNHTHETIVKNIDYDIDRYLNRYLERHPEKNTEKELEKAKTKGRKHVKDDTIEFFNLVKNMEFFSEKYADFLQKHEEAVDLPRTLLFFYNNELTKTLIHAMGQANDIECDRDKYFIIHVNYKNGFGLVPAKKIEDKTESPEISPRLNNPGKPDNYLSTAPINISTPPTSVDSESSSPIPNLSPPLSPIKKKEVKEVVVMEEDIYDEMINFAMSTMTYQERAKLMFAAYKPEEIAPDGMDNNRKRNKSTGSVPSLWIAESKQEQGEEEMKIIKPSSFTSLKGKKSSSMDNLSSSISRSTDSLHSRSVSSSENSQEEFSISTNLKSWNKTHGKVSSINFTKERQSTVSERQKVEIKTEDNLITYKM